MAGIIYIVVNQAMPGFIKIGKTDGDLAARIRSLNNTSVPLEFECFYAARVEDCEKVEALLHDAFADHRPNPKREFFTVAPERAKSALMIAALEDVTPTIDEVVPDAAERAAVESVARQRRNTSLFDIGLTAGDTLLLDRDPNTTCEVADPWRVRFKGEVMTPSKSAHQALQALGYNWPSANGWLHWTWQDRPLRAHVDDHLGQ